MSKSDHPQFLTKGHRRDIHDIDLWMKKKAEGRTKKPRKPKRKHTEEPCKGIKKDGSPCQALPAEPGGEYCRFHRPAVSD